MTSYYGRQVRQWSVMASTVILACAARTANAQHAVPGVYTSGGCKQAPFPEVLPALNNVVDSVALFKAVNKAGLGQPVDLSIRMGGVPADPPVSVIWAAGTDDNAIRIATATQILLRSGPRNSAWSFRLHLEPGTRGPQAMLERSLICAPVSHGGTQLTYTAATVSVTQPTRTNPSALERARVKLLVGANGLVLRQVVLSNGWADHDLSRTIHVRSYSPATLDGRPVAAWIETDGLGNYVNR